MGMSEYQRDIIKTIVASLPSSPIRALLDKLLREDAQQQEKGDAAKDWNITIHHIIEYKDREGSREAAKTSSRHSPLKGFAEDWQDPIRAAEGTRPVDVYYVRK